MIRLMIYFCVLAIGHFPRFRRIAHANLRIAFGPRGPRIYFRSLIRLADNVCAILKTCRRNPARRPRFRYDISVVKAAQVVPPYICVSGHLGPFDLGAKLEKPLQTRMAVVVRPPGGWLVRRVVALIRRRLGTDTIEKRNAFKGCVEALKEGKSVAILADQNAGYQGEFYPFLGFPASTTRLPVVLAMRFQLPMVFGFLRKDGDGYLAWIEKVLVPNARADRDDEERRLMNEMNAVFGDVIRRHPEEWFWPHRRWKTRPGDREASILR